MSGSNVFFLDPGPEPSAQITQLYRHLELFRDGLPPRNTLFILGRQAGNVTVGMASDRLLLIDPPADVLQRFRLEGEAAVLFTSMPIETGLPSLQTQDGGVAHIRIGDHFLDIYSQSGSNLVHFPAIGILCGGPFGSDVLLPNVSTASDGKIELDALRLLASLLKRQHFQLFVPRHGSIDEDKVEVMKRLAADVAYLNGLRSVIGDALARGDAIETIEVRCNGALPIALNSPLNRAIHEANVATMVAAIGG